MKKFSACMLALLMLLSVLTGCASGSGETAAPTDTTDASGYDVISIKEALELCGDEGNITTERYYIRGTVETVTNAQFGAMVITDGTDSIPVYGTFSKDGSVGYADMREKPYKGDEVLLSCILQNFNGSRAIKNAWLISFKQAEHKVNEADYTAMNIAKAREAARDTLVRVEGVVAKITYANGMKPNGFFLVDDTQSIYVYDGDVAQRVKEGNKITILASKTYWILEKEMDAAKKFGYNGCCQLENAYLKANDEKTDNAFSTKWIQETTIKNLMDTPVSEDFTSAIYKVNALVHKEPGSGFTNYYFYDLDGKTGSYTYSQCNGEDFAWLDAYDGKICTVYLSVLNAKSTSTGCVYRFVPIQIVSDKFTFDGSKGAEYAVKYHGVDQFNTSYTGDPALELVTSVSSDLLGIKGAKLSYASSNDKIVSFEKSGSKVIMHCQGKGTATVHVTGSYKGKTYKQDVTVKVDAPVIEKYMNVKQAIGAKVGEVVTVKGIIGPSLVNKTGFYLIDDTGVISIILDQDKLEGLAIGQEVVLKGKRDLFIKEDKDCYGQTALTECEIVANKYGKHDYSAKSFITGKTLADVAGLDINKDYTCNVYVVKATVVIEKNAYYTSIKIKDGDTELRLYSSSAKQYSFLEQFDGKEITIELAPCNWNSKSYYAGCVLAVRTADGKIYNELNFKH